MSLLQLLLWLSHLRRLHILSLNSLHVAILLHHRSLHPWLNLLHWLLLLSHRPHLWDLLLLLLELSRGSYALPELHLLFVIRRRHDLLLLLLDVSGRSDPSTYPHLRLLLLLGLLLLSVEVDWLLLLLYLLSQRVLGLHWHFLRLPSHQIWLLLVQLITNLLWRIGDHF